jgi:hypothetical protein
VAEAFMGPTPVGLEVCHNNDDKADNRLTNLRFDTHLANMRDAVRNGLNPAAAQTHCGRGHPFDAENTRRPAKHPSRRICRACQRERYLRRRAQGAA